MSGLAADLRAMGVETILDLWEVRYGESFTTYMQRHIAKADVILFVISAGAVVAAEARDGEGGALQFEVQMMNARRMSEGVRIIGVYRSGDRPPEYLRDHRYVDFRSEREYRYGASVARRRSARKRRSATGRGLKVGEFTKAWSPGERRSVHRVHGRSSPGTI